jgi:hypothetical protein
VTSNSDFDIPDSVLVIDTTSNQVVKTIPMGPQSVLGPIAIAPDGVHAYVGMEISRSLSVINTGSNQVVGEPIPVGDFMGGAVISHRNFIINFGPVFWAPGVDLRPAGAPDHLCRARRRPLARRLGHVGLLRGWDGGHHHVDGHRGLRLHASGHVHADRHCSLDGREPGL